MLFRSVSQSRYILNTRSSPGSANGGAFGNDTFTGFINVIGSSLSDSIIGDSGANSIIGLDGADTVTGGLGSNTLDGGDGVDVVTYQSLTSAVTVNLGARSASGTGVTDTITLFENVIGFSLSDSIIGDAGNNSISAGVYIVTGKQIGRAHV